MRNKLYNYFVHRNENVRHNYELYKNKHIRKRSCDIVFDWLHLLWLNIKYRLLRINPPSIKKLKFPESVASARKDSASLFRRAMDYDVISFDLYDSLLLKRVNSYADMFTLIGIAAGNINFRESRIKAEHNAVRKKYKQGGRLINVYDIYDCFDSIPKEEKDKYIELEFEFTLKCCYANSFIKEVYDKLILSNKTVIAVCNTYWTIDYIKKLLDKCGYKHFDEIFISNEHNALLRDNKSLQELVSKTYLNKSIIYFGDVGCKKKSTSNWAYEHYPNVEKIGRPYRLKNEFNCIVIYKSIINNKLHSAAEVLNPCYEHAFVYGGIMVYGYSQWLEQQAKEKSIDLLLFTARDCETMYEIYQKHFNGTKSKYIYCSREAILKAVFPAFADVFFEVMFASKTSLRSKIKIIDFLSQIGLQDLRGSLERYGFTDQDYISKSNLDTIKKWFYDNKFAIEESFSKDKAAAKEYFKCQIDGCERICVVDLGWRGTVFAAIKHLLHQIDNSLYVIGTVCGSTNSEIPNLLIDSNQLFSYMFSHKENTDLQILPKHIMLLEALFSSGEATIRSYGFNKDGRPQLMRDENHRANNSAVYQMFKQGMHDFCDEFVYCEKIFGETYQISGREAYLPINIINTHYDYNMRLFNALRITDVRALDEENIKEVLSRLGYHKR